MTATLTSAMKHEPGTDWTKATVRFHAALQDGLHPSSHAAEVARFIEILFDRYTTQASSP
jgi:hypothetical protein